MRYDFLVLLTDVTVPCEKLFYNNSTLSVCKLANCTEGYYSLLMGNVKVGCWCNELCKCFESTPRYLEDDIWICRKGNGSR